MGPLNGIRVIDMTSVLMGPYATQMLGDYGADVVKIEAPNGDVIRRIGPARHRGMGPLFLNTNRSKRSITLDLKQAEGRDALLRLCADADILAYNIRPKAMERLGLGYDAVCAVNPAIIYAGMFGYSQNGPYAARPAYDDLIQGGSALPYLVARSSGGTPRYVPNAIADRVVGLAAVGAIVASLVHRDRTGQGQRVDIPMYETMVSFVLGDHMGGLTFEPPLDRGGYIRQLSADRRPYPTSDGHVCALIYTDDQWTKFLEAIGRADLPETDPRFAGFENRMEHIDFVYGELARIFETRTTDEWLALLDRADIPYMPMYDLAGVLSDPHLVETGFFSVVSHPSQGQIRTMAVPVAWSKTKAEPVRHAPRQGEHTVEILSEAGFTPDEIAGLLSRKIVQAPDDAIRNSKAQGRP